jgi:UDP-N-acetyl-D-glucosamine dehydrogenase
MLNKTVCVVGLGYVGLPLLCLCIEKGYKTYGFDINEKSVDLINNGKSPIKDKFLEEKLDKLKDKIDVATNPEVIRNSDIIIICVPTPIDSHYNPDLKPLEKAAKTVSENFKNGDLVVIESTVFPGTTEEIVKPILEKSGLKAGKDFYLAYCPERVDPGNKKWNVSNLPRVVGALTKEGLKLSSDFYRSLTSSEVLELNSIKAAEATKIMENTFRDVNIAFVNEMAKSFDRMGIDITEVIKGASTKPFAFMPHWPGCGVGGHCIKVDPYYLISRARENGFNHQFLNLTREINNSMPHYTVEKVIEGLNEIDKSVKDTKITVLGLAYKGGVDDMRESPALEIIDELKKLGADLKVFDPYVLDKSIVNDLDEALDAECIVIATDHPEFKALRPAELKEKGIKVVIDGKNCLDKKGIKALGIIYKGIGR